MTCVIASFLCGNLSLIKAFGTRCPSGVLLYGASVFVLLTATYFAAYVFIPVFRCAFQHVGRVFYCTLAHTHPYLLDDGCTAALFESNPCPVLVFLSIGVALFITISITAALEISAILAIYSLAAGAVGMLCGQVFRDTLFGTECATLLWCVLIAGALLLNPLKRYVDDPQPFIPLVLHLNPLIAVNGIFEGLDIFRKPVLYELTPVTSYNYQYPNPWSLVGLWHLVIGGCCFLGTWWMCRFRSYNT